MRPNDVRWLIVVAAASMATSGCIISDPAQIAAMSDEDLCGRLSLDPGNGFIRAELDSRGAFTSDEWLLLERQQVGIGMSALGVLCSWGQPDDVYQTVTATGSSQQWQYGRRTVNVEDGKVTAYQE